MKNVVITLLFLLISVSATKAQEVHKATTIIATYSGNSTDVYYFTNNLDQKDLQFVKIEPEVLAKYDLHNNSFLNKTFRVAYIIDTEGGNTTSDPKGPKKIIDLTLIEESEDE